MVPPVRFIVAARRWCILASFDHDVDAGYAAPINATTSLVDVDRPVHTELLGERELVGVDREPGDRDELRPASSDARVRNAAVPCPTRPHSTRRRHQRRRPI
jgi:hypothetical protein